MPDQPADPLHYDMKIPPEKKPDKPGNALSEEQLRRGSEENATDTGKPRRDRGLPAGE